ncbi:DHHA1 domain-containing protein [Clostridium sp.]|uniref:alanyl-tRNA editing protein n=1 Tax=Clostridium sp. TaxID=1506 RepID=UPI00258FF7E5|nr:DHHA1 domain-containing protein [Clostridium sp.]MDU4848293.1 DHHA1 domain-containing protein [Clostridium sp.]
MEQLYYENPYLKEFTANIIDAKEIDGKFHLILDNTAFFPGGGGQWCDTGKIGNLYVLEVYEKENTIYHVVSTAPSKMTDLKCVIDWNTRIDGMQQHLGQHVLSGSFFNLFNANTFAIHLGADISTVDILGNLTEEQVREAERLANKIIGDNVPVLSFIPSEEELKNIKLRRALPNTEEDIRVVHIKDFDINACCGLHPTSTKDLRLIKIKRFTKHKEGTRIEFLAGNRAVEDTLKKDELFSSICSYLSCNENEALNGIKNLNASLKDANDTNKSLNTLLAKYQVNDLIDNAENIGDYKVIKQIFDGDMKYVNTLTSKLVENDNIIALMAVKNSEKANLLFSCSKNIKDIKMNELFKDAIAAIDGRGGGSPFQAQGAGKNNENLEKALEIALTKIKNF